MTVTGRQLFAPSDDVLSYDSPVHTRPSSGTRFHSLQATSQALHPMQSDVSVKNPIRGWASSPYVSGQAAGFTVISATLISTARARAGSRRARPAAARVAFARAGCRT